MQDPKKTGETCESQRGTNFIKKLIQRTVSVDLASVNSATHAEQDVSVSGLLATEVVLNFYPAEALGVAVGVVYARTKQAGTITVGVTNPTAGALDAGAKNFTLLTAILG